MRAKSTEWFVGIIFAIFGIGLIIGGIFSSIYNAKFKDTALPTTAEVISVSKHTDSDGDTSYTVYVSYNVNGTMYNGSYNTSSYLE